MKCSQCYGENPPWATVCVACGQAVRRLELCPAGHLLPPGEQECAVCPDLWPEVAPFVGAPLLRGLLWLESGRLFSDGDPGQSRPYVEVRDQDLPLALAIQAGGTIRIADADDPAVVCRILMRPEGVQVCSRQGTRPRSGPPVYDKLKPDGTFQLAGATFRYLQVQPPAWAEELAAQGPRG
jgi:hypothetical protein